MNNAVPFEWIAAVRFLREGRMQTLFIISGVSVGIAVIVLVSLVTPAPNRKIQELVEHVRYPNLRMN